MIQTSDDIEERAWSPETHCLALDGIRGFAILIVTLYRLFKELDPSSHPLIGLLYRIAPLGGRGVDLFFVLSGFLITGILIRSKGKPKYFRNFIARRSLRIFPLYFLSLAVGLWAIPRHLGGQLFERARMEQVYLWTYTSNVRVSWLNEWCFGPFDHFWSLAVEEHFYLVWPAIVFILTTKRLGWFCALTVVAVAIARSVAETFQSLDIAVDVLTVFRIDALCLGALLAVIMQSSIRHERIRSGAFIAAILSLGALILVVLLGSRMFGLPALLCRMIFMAGIAFILLSPKTSIFPRFFESSVMRFLGKYSYGMYVVQLPLVTLVPAASLSSLLPSNPIAVGIFYVAGMFGCISIMALLSFHLFESHFLKLKKWFH
jgi:peptidoglycan/LPS O-acetylase OafA/YrhL